MTFTWRDLLQITRQMWGLNQNYIAESLDVHRSTISNLLSGKQKRLDKSYNEIYRALFDPTNDKGPVYGRDKNFLLNDLVKSLSDEKYEGVINRVKYDSYESLVMEIIRLINDSEPQLRSKPERISKSSNNESVSTNEDIGAQLHILDKYKTCLYCKRWNGNVEDAKKIASGVYGRCIIYNQDQRSTGGANCNDYDPNEPRITSDTLLSNINRK